MRPVWKDFLTALGMGFVLPGILLNLAVRYSGYGEVPAPVETEPPIPAAASVPLMMRMRDQEGNVSEMDMDTYLVGVILAEMPADFEMEALKAQSVAARTYTRKASVTGGKHGDGSVCTQPSCCQGYLDPEEYLGQGGTREGVDKIRSAVLSASGYVLTYEGSLIEATYFSCSGGSTEDAAAVWGTEFPYLQAVESPGEEDAAHYTDTVVFTPEEFRRALNIQGSSDPYSWVGPAVYTEGGGVASIRIGGKTYTGTQLRSELGLRSTAFTIVTAPSGITVTTFGHGHRVGMSQYGADAMAASGSSFEQILAHYYPGTKLVRLESDAEENG